MQLLKISLKKIGAHYNVSIVTIIKKTGRTVIFSLPVSTRTSNGTNLLLPLGQAIGFAYTIEK